MSSRCPIVAQTDLLIVGLTAAAVELARAVKKSGRQVFVIGTRSFAGEDICGRMQYWPQDDDTPRTELAKQLFSEHPPTPAHVKLTLEQALVEHQIPILLNTHPAAVLRNTDNKIDGLIITNRSGRQAVTARLIVDATITGRVAALAGVKMAGPLTGMQPVSHTALYRTQPEQTPAGIDHLQTLPGYQGRCQDTDFQLQAIRYDLSVDFGDGSATDLANAQANVIDQCWVKGEFQHQELLQPLNRVHAVPVRGDGKSITLADLTVQSGLVMLSAMAPVSDPSADQLDQPIPAMTVAAELADACCRQIDKTPKPVPQRIEAAGSQPVDQGKIMSLHDALRPDCTTEQAMEDDLSQLPILGQFDVVVAGGGTGGAPAGIAAAMAGARTLVIETTGGLGGVSTMGQIARYYYGNRVGFTAQIDAGTNTLEFDPAVLERDDSWSVDARCQWYHHQSLAHDVCIMYHSTCVGVRVDNNTVTGLVVAGPFGFGLVETRTVVDATGCADIPAMAGAATKAVGAEHMAVQGTGLMGVTPGIDYNNSDHSFSDDTDTLDATHFFISSHLKFKNHFDFGQLIDSRERRQIIGAFSLGPADFMCQRRFPDTICVASSNFDTHGYTIHPLFFVKAPDKTRLWVDVPYRCLLPKTLDGVLVTGLGVSAHRDALPVIRMQPDVQNQGYAAGRAAALAARRQITPRALDLKSLQQHLIEMDILPQRVLTDSDSFPVDDETVANAVAEGWDDFAGLSIIFAEPDRARPLLISAFNSTEKPDQQLRYAQILAMLDDPTGLALLSRTVDAAEWDAGWNYRGMGQFGASVSQLDSLLIALGRIGTEATWPVIERKIQSLPENPDFSHCRALALCCADLYARHPKTEPARLLARLLSQPGIAGHDQPVITKLQAELTDVTNENNVRNRALREIHLARGLYRCGDHSGLGRDILEKYSRDLRGHFARHARAILAG